MDATAKESKTAGDRSEDSSMERGLPHGTVHLLTGAKVPAGHRKLVPVQIRGVLEVKSLLFTPDIDETSDMEEGNLAIADALIEGGGNRLSATLLIENRGTTPAILEAGMGLGTVVAAEPVSRKDLQDVESPQAAGGSALTGVGERVCAVTPTQVEDRRRRLREQLQEQLASLTEVERLELEDQVLSYHDVFAVESSELGTTDVTEHTINTGTHPPIRQPARRIPFALREKIDKLVGEMLEQQVIVPSASPWASPVVLVRKKDGSMRFCVDYRKLKNWTSFHSRELMIPSTSCQGPGISRHWTWPQAIGKCQWRGTPKRRQHSPRTQDFTSSLKCHLAS